MSIINQPRTSNLLLHPFTPEKIQAAVGHHSRLIHNLLKPLHNLCTNLCRNLCITRNLPHNLLKPLGTIVAHPSIHAGSYNKV